MKPPRPKPKYNVTQFVGWRRLLWTSFGTADISLGIHICWAGRVDLHIGTGMLSIGRIPMYQNEGKPPFSVSNSFHEDKKKPMRAGVP